jgi:hypothetical protein
VNEQHSRAKTRRTKAVGTAKRLAVREYLPLASWVLSWFMIGVAIGHADAVRLLAANAFVQAVRHVCTLEAMPLFGLRERTAETFRQARRAAIRLELAGLAASIVGVLLLAGLLEYRGLGQVAVMVAIAAVAIPARTPAALLVAHRQRFPTWRIGSGLTFAAGSAAVLLFGGDWMAAAAVLALREWGALIATLLFAPERKNKHSRSRPLTFEEVARRTEANARQKLSYRLISSISSLLLGPFGNLAARTGREMGRLDSRLAKLVPRKKSGFALFTLGTVVVAATFLFVSREPSTVLGAAAFARLAASGATVLMWWRYGSDAADDDDLDEE